MEFFIAWYSGNPYERFTFINRATGPYWWAYATMVSCNVLIPQLFWFKRIRTNMVTVFIISILVNVGMWFERFVIVVSSLHCDFLPSSWSYYWPTWVDICTFIGTFGLFFTMFLLFLRFLPMIAIAEVKGVTPQSDPHDPAGGAKLVPGRVPVAQSPLTPGTRGAEPKMPRTNEPGKGKTSSDYFDSYGF
jgi:molybdopterin-containing oxidoreductase family membrane subunit